MYLLVAAGSEGKLFTLERMINAINIYRKYIFQTAPWVSVFIAVWRKLREFLFFLFSPAYLAWHET